MEDLTVEELREFRKEVLKKNIEELLRDTKGFLARLDEFEEI